jgi:PAS domain S-box-containing protein
MTNRRDHTRGLTAVPPYNNVTIGFTEPSGATLTDLSQDAPSTERFSLVRLAPRPAGREDHFRTILDNLPAAIYVTDAHGRITYFNEAAADLWGHRPELGRSEWCGSWKLFWPDGRALPHGDCPMAIALKEQRIIRGTEAIAERPDGSRVPFMPYPTPLFDKTGELVGAVNMQVDLSEPKRANEVAHRLATIIASSDDAIISKDLNGVIQSWNEGATRIFGYTAEEAVGRPVTMLIPEDRHDEEPEILARLRRGERIEHYETVRRRKDGELIDIALSVSPVRNYRGEIVGAAKIARDITERRRAAEQQQLLLREMDHRVKNLFALVGGLVSLSARSASTPDELAAAVRERLAALGLAHSLTLRGPDTTSQGTQPSMLRALIGAITSPYDVPTSDDRSRVRITGTDVEVSPAAVTNVALLLHEFTTNAAKYGALSTPSGYVEVECAEDGQLVELVWRERDGPAILGVPTTEGFGTRMAQMTVENQFRGAISREWNPEGLTLRLSIPRERLAD